MNPGLMDRRLVLQVNTPAQGVTGEPVESWSTLATVWGRRQDTSGSERNAEGQEIAKVITSFTIRWRSDVNAANRIVYDSITYDITFTEEIGRKEYLKLYAERRNDG